MNSKEAVIAQDMDRIANDTRIPWDQLQGKTVLVTGATGLIGRTLVRALLHRSESFHDGITVVAPVRSMEKARKLFADSAALKLIEGSMEALPAVAGPVDYVIHCACPTDSGFFLNHPVDTIQTILEGTKNILELAREKEAKGVVFLSSMEVYGRIDSEVLLGEDTMGTIDLMSPRSSYPLAKRMAENLCCSYWSQYGVPAMVCRLAQTFGPGVSGDDKRVFAYMARCALDGRNIELATSGAKKNMYLYTADAVTAILTILLCGKPATAYNAANSQTYCSIKEMGQAVADAFGKGDVQVKTNVNAEQSAKYRPNSYLWLDTARLQSLGWKPTVGLMEMYERMMSAF